MHTMMHHRARSIGYKEKSLRHYAWSEGFLATPYTMELRTYVRCTYAIIQRAAVHNAYHTSLHSSFPRCSELQFTMMQRVSIEADFPTYGPIGFMSTHVNQMIL